jgi:hypothetical protein
MKKLTLLMFLAFSLNAFAQIEKPITKGNIMLSGGGSMSYGDSNLEASTYNSNTSAFSVSFTPGASYFIMDNLAIGLNATFTYDGRKNNKSYTVGIGPKVRYYFNNGIFLNAEVDYNYNHGISNTSNRANYLSFKPGIGYSFFLNQKVSLEPGIYYEINNEKYETSFGPATIKSNTVMFDLILNVFL